MTEYYNPVKKKTTNHLTGLIFRSLILFEVLTSFKLKEHVSMSFFLARQVEHELKAAQEVCGWGLDDSPSG